MTVLGSKLFLQTLKAACVVAGMMAAMPSSYAQSGGPFAGLEGAWTGTGTILEIGRASCRERVSSPV